MATNFFEQQDHARRNTGRLLIYYALAILGIIATIYLAALLIFGFVDGGDQAGGTGSQPEGILAFWNPTLFGIVSVGTIAVVGLSSLMKISQLSSGGSAVAEMLGGRLIPAETSDPILRRLLNIVEEMALASGVPVPAVYLMNEEGINAFAAGYAPGDAVIGVTRGTLTYLSRDELQGVIAHEFSHILNGDMRINIRLIGILAGILTIGLLGQILMRGGFYGSVGRSQDDRRSGQQMAIFGLVLILIGGIGVFFGRLIQAAVSRQREFLADASAVQFTRNPDGIAGALKKIGGLAQGSRLQNAEATEACHMFFGDAVGPVMQLDALATHPPLAERIKRIDPSFDGRFPEHVEPAMLREEPRRSRPHASDRRNPFDALTGPMGAAGRVGGGMVGPAVVLGSADLTETVGSPDPRHVAFAERLLEVIPTGLRRATGDPFSARCLVHALLLDDDARIRQDQLSHLRQQADRGTAEEVQRLVGAVAELPTIARTPLIELALPSLRQLSPGQYRRFRENVQALIQADQKFTIFEYVLMRMIVRHLDGHFGSQRRPAMRYRSLAAVQEPLVVLLSSLARIGHQEPSLAREAFDNAIEKLGLPGRALAPVDQCGLEAIDASLKTLIQTTPPIRRRVLDGCAQAIVHDGTVTVAEAELLRGIADGLECPLPPLLDVQLEGVPTPSTS